MRIRRMRPSSGAVIGTVALVFALSGVAVAATKIDTNDIVNKAVTGKKIASDAVKGGKILDGKVKAKDLAAGVLPEVPQQAYGRVNKAGTTVAPAQGSVGITGTASGGQGVTCYDLAFAPVSGTATPVAAGNDGTTAEVHIGPAATCPAPYNDASTATFNPDGPDVGTDADPADEDLYVDFVG